MRPETKEEREAREWVEFFHSGDTSTLEVLATGALLVAGIVALVYLLS